MMKKLLLIAVAIMAAYVSSAQTVIQAEKRQEIEKMLRLTGMEKVMDQMKAQMITSLKTQIAKVPEEFWTKFQKKMDTRELIEKLMPLYDKYYTLEDLRAINAFYESPAGQKILSTLPQIMQESMKIGQEWGQKIGREAAEEAENELKKGGQK